MESAVTTEAQALFDYDRQHFDELSFKTGDIIKVLKEIDGGWWHGELNGTQVSCSRSADTSHLLSFQQEIVQHILEGESKQIADLNLLIRILKPNVEVLSELLSRPKFVGKLFLDVAKNMDQLAGEYTRSCAYIEFGLQEAITTIPVAVGAAGQDLYSTKTKSLFASVHDRLSRYPILLKETERYYEDPHPDRTAICKAMQVYSEILDRCDLLRNLREVDIEVLSSEIRGLPDQSRPQMNDPTLTLKASICVADADGHFVIDSSKPQAVLLLYPSFILILSAVAPWVYQFRMHVPISNITVTALQENENVISVKIVGGSLPSEEHNLHLWCTGVCTRDLFYSTVIEFIRNSKVASSNGPQILLLISSKAVLLEEGSSSCMARSNAPTGGYLLLMTKSAEAQQEGLWTVAANDQFRALQQYGGCDLGVRIGQLATRKWCCGFSVGRTAGGAILRQRSATRAAKPGGLGLLRRRSAGGATDEGGCSGFAAGTAAPHLFALRSSHSGPICGPAADREAEAFDDVPTPPSTSPPPPPPPRTNAIAVTDLTNLPGCRFLSHEVRTRPLVKWPEDILTMPKRQEVAHSSAFKNPQQNLQNQQEDRLTHLRLDCTPLQSHCSLISGSGGEMPPRSGARVTLAGGHGNRGSRPNSPGRSGASGEGRGAAASAGKVMRRKRTDEVTQRNEKDAKILQIIELYCGSGLPKGALKPLDLTQLRLSCTEMRMKENSLPPPGTTAPVGPTVPPRTYENIDPTPPMVPLRPPPIILPTSASAQPDTCMSSPEFVLELSEELLESAV
ncbi:Rho guanine nucleotide exchange factor 7 [Echinococcus granulosus]|uniref:Rho guanine nucleotide exchange factor 7 n=1 Tax=Echinococcus granulosus TaxID=6210 RepID=W6UH37_ECHGR|nr:Rho guanine nucleotide exchange factor 7 [Echinococcus granulosus]EUB60326.1 Rho guanine nucleotide exchange factor 7 [Echinococcus granulosus]